MGSANGVVAYFDDLVARDVHEVPDGSNKTEVGVEFGWNGVPWCCETCSNGLKRAGVPGFHTASVYQAIEDARKGKNGLTLLPRDAEIRRGDFVTYDWKGKGNPSDFHIALVVNPGTQAKFETKAGNENNRAMGQWRDRKFVSHFIRPAYDSAAPAPQPTPKEWYEMPLDAQAKKDLKELIADVVKGAQDGSPLLIGPDDGRVHIKIPGDYAVWVTAPEGVAVSSRWVAKDGSDFSGGNGVEPGPKGIFTTVAEGAGGAWYEHAGGDGFVTVQLFSNRGANENW